jgi:hypothetical protein
MPKGNSYSNIIPYFCTEKNPRGGGEGRVDNIALD